MQLKTPKPLVGPLSSMVTFRRLIVALLFVPFLSGVNVPAAASVHGGATAEADVITSVTGRLTDPALPVAAAIGVMLELGSAASWRTPTHSSGNFADPLGAVEMQTARARIGRLDRAWLHYCYALDRARTNVPITYGNPPPSL